jgi:Nitrile hydratase beta subunit
LGGVHDMGGSPGGSIDRDQHEVEDWERLADAINGALGAKGFQSTDELRRAIESLEEYRDLSYYERWVAATEKLLVEKGILSSKEIDERAASIRHRWDGP